MPNLYTIAVCQKSSEEALSAAEKFSVVYHNLFDYPLTFADLIKWSPGKVFSPTYAQASVICQNGYFLLQGREGLDYKRALRGRISVKKLEIAIKASNILSLIPSVKMVAVTGSLAMDNAADESDIDFLIITKANLIWTTRLLSYLFLKIFKFDLRKAGDKKQKDKACLNMWLDKGDLAWRKNDRNFYTAHEIAQIVPLVNKDKTYEMFLYENRWILKYWPNAVRIVKSKKSASNNNWLVSLLLTPIEKVAYWLQYWYMKPKITREIVMPKRAIFHPQDWGAYVLSRLSP